MATFHDTCLYFCNKGVATTATKLNKIAEFLLYLWKIMNKKHFVVLKVWIDVFCSQEK